VGLVLAPHWSRGSVGEYHERAAATAAEHGAGYAAIERWHDLPAWRAAMAQRVRDGLAKLPGSSPAGTVAPAGTAVPGGTAGPAGRTRVLFTAHSLPERVLADDPYADELEESAAAIAAEVGLEPGTGWSLAWQSAGRTPEPWRGPDILEVVTGLGEAGDVDGVLVCPQGFVSDHLEVLYDLDVDAARAAAEVGLAFARTASINDDPAVMAALADRVRACARP
jgi:ferrochelatase